MRNPHFIRPVRKPGEAEHDDPEILLTHIRMKSHLLDKEMQLSASRKIRFSPTKLKDITERLRNYREKCSRVGSDFRWAEGIKGLYARAVQEQQDFRYPWLRKQKARISESAFEKLLTTRRSIRRFTAKEVDDRLIRRIITLAQWSPTNSNQQSLRFIVVTRPEIRRQVVLGGMEGDFSPCIIAVLADMRFYSPGDIECPAHDAGAAIQTMLLAAHYYGLGTCYASSLSCNSKKYRALLRVQEHEKIMAFIWVGHCECWPIAPARRKVSEIIRKL